MKIKDEIVNVLATSLVAGYEKASVEAAIKVLVGVVTYIHEISEEQRKELETDLKWTITTKLKEFNKEES